MNETCIIYNTPIPEGRQVCKNCEIKILQPKTNMYYITGKSAVGKDTIYTELLKTEYLNLKEIVLYTTRPMRPGEENGKQYFFVTNKEMEKLKQSKNILEYREYKTTQGLWTYATVMDDNIITNQSLISIGTLESFNKIKQKIKNSNLPINLIPIYIELDEKTRTRRATKRENKKIKPDYEELNRRTQADNIDFSEENIRNAGISSKNRFVNHHLKTCVANIINYITTKEKLAKQS